MTQTSSLGAPLVGSNDGDCPGWRRPLIRTAVVASAVMVVVVVVAFLLLMAPVAPGGATPAKSLRIQAPTSVSKVFTDTPGPVTVKLANELVGHHSNLSLPPGWLCSNTCAECTTAECEYGTIPPNKRGVCMDGGPGAGMWQYCDYGTQCNDCGPRPDRENWPTTCENSCNFIDDGACDDGGAGAQSARCAYGTDCNDCGLRSHNYTS
mmetsp:Transcript_15496/g.28747  ORF Transcript_15496/g.28747 Transcript_15496/m.28747 type:complete len:208 (+) Transcript_15496:101-724(+)